MTSNTIVSAGEDCRYKVWDSFGRLLFSSRPQDHMVTCVKWAPNGLVFAVGSFQTLRLCDRTGWTHAFTKPNAKGSILAMDWSSDSTQLAGACGNGSVVFSSVVGQTINSDYLTVKLEDEKLIKVTDVVHEISEELDFKDRVINMALGHAHLIVTTVPKC